MNKASGGDGIPVELFQILKNDAMKGLHSICQQIGKLSSGHRTGNSLFPECVVEELHILSVETHSITLVLMLSYHTGFLCCLDMSFHFPQGGLASLIRSHTPRSSSNSFQILLSAGSQRQGLTGFLVEERMKSTRTEERPLPLF